MPNTIDRLVRSKHTKGVAREAASAFKPENLNARVDEIIKNNPIVAHYVQQNPAYRDELLSMAKDRYARSWQYFVGGKFVDNTKALMSTAGLISDLAGPATGGGGNVLSGLEEVLELLPTSSYLTMYAIGMNDYKFIPKAVAYEAASFIPVVGDIMDMNPIYTKRVRQRFDELVAEDFLAKVSNGKSRTNH